jgi:hypothetical protein
MEQLSLLVLLFFCWFFFIIMSFALFRVRLKNNWWPILFSALMTTSASYLMQTLHFEFLVSFVQPLIFVLGYIFIIKLNWINSVFMVLTAYFINLIIEVLINLVLSGFEYSTFIEIYRSQVYLQGIIITSCNFIIAMVLIKFRLGFSFFSSFRTSPFPKLMYFTLVVGSLSIALASFNLYLWDEWSTVTYSAHFLILILFLHFFYKKDLID